MGVLLAHTSFDWIIAGIVVFAGLVVFITKLLSGNIIGVITGGAVWYFVYSIHSGTNTGIMTATLAALLFDLIGLPLIYLLARR